MEERRENEVVSGETAASQGFTDDFVIGEGFAINENATPSLSAKSKKKKSSVWKTVKPIIWILSIIIIPIIIAGSALLVVFEYLGLGKSGNECVIEIAEGTPTIQIAQQLKDEGAIVSPVRCKWEPAK